MPSSPNRLSQFWQELKRRRVIHVIVVYATAAFVILEAVDIIFPRLNFPDWTVTFVMILLAVGFPIALIGAASYIYSGWEITSTNSATIGYLQLYALILIAPVSFIFAPLGAKLAHSISEKTLRLSFAFLLSLLSITMFLS